MDLGGPLCQIAKQRPAVQNCGFHWDQNSDIPRSRTTWPDLGFSDAQWEIFRIQYMEVRWYHIFLAIGIVGIFPEKKRPEKLAKNIW